MNERTNLYRKLAYAVGIAVLLFPLSLLGSPRIAGKAVGESSRGGKLAEFREAHGLSQGNLGEIDPASETLKLATLGLRGVAVNVLWNKANEFKKKEDWGNLTATLEQLSKLQPNFITFWKYQAWNLTYNVSVEFDDYRDRYYYVRRGIDFLKDGEKYNKNNPQLLWELGWFIGQKIGRADEKLQYRRLFRDDEKFHPEDRPQEERDNWLVSKEWYIKAERAAETRGIGRKSPVVFYSSSPKSQMNYAEAIEEEGRFDRGLPAWRQAGLEWDDFGNLPIEHSTGTILNLNEEKQLKDQLQEARTKLTELAPDATKPLFESLTAKLTAEQRQALETPSEERTEEQQVLAQQAEVMIVPPDRDVVAAIVAKDPELRVEALRLGEEIDLLADRLRKTQNYKQTSNFDYWKLRSEFEQSADALNARKLCYQAKTALQQDADPEQAKRLYEQGLAKWRAVLDAYPELRDKDGTTGSDIMVYIKEYAGALEKIDEEIPESFPLWDVIEGFDDERDFVTELQRHQQQSGSFQEPEAEVDVVETASGADDPQDSAPSE
jgi:hypothetical protein